MVGFSVTRNYMNDSLRTDVFLRYSAETVACACIYLSARALQVSNKLFTCCHNVIKMTTLHIILMDYFLMDSGWNYLLQVLSSSQKQKNNNNLTQIHANIYYRQIGI